MPRSVGGSTLRFLISIALSCVVLACTGRVGSPSNPTRTLVPDVVGVAKEFKWGPCASILVVLESDVTLTAYDPNVRDPLCANNPTPPPTTFLFGSADDLHKFVQGEGDIDDRGGRWPPRHGPLLFSGSDAGSTWMAVARWDGTDAWCVTFNEDNGAYLEGNRLHVVKGVLIPLAQEFTWPLGDPDTAFPLRQNDGLCLNVRGEAVRTQIATLW